MGLIFLVLLIFSNISSLTSKQELGWVGGKIYYKFSDTFQAKHQKAKIHKWMAHMETKFPCIQFEIYDDDHGRFITITAEDDDCSRKGKVLNLGSSCLKGLSEETGRDIIGDLLVENSWESEKDVKPVDKSEITRLYDCPKDKVDQRAVLQSILDFKMKMKKTFANLNAQLKTLDDTFDDAVGPPGIPGTKGFPGSKGNKGISGRPGSFGLIGLKGEKGSVGLPGPSCGYEKSTEGIIKVCDGVPGLPGFNGQKGNIGPPGVGGPVGPPGPEGPPGFEGAAGYQGPKGDPGFPGQSGFPGDKGEKGTRGEPAPSCSDSAGCIPVVGPPGVPGKEGERGVLGVNGMPGYRGDKGEQGFDGRPGFPGRPGDKGFKGVGGDQGLPGRAGQHGQKGEAGGCSARTCNKDSPLSREGWTETETYEGCPANWTQFSSSCYQLFETPKDFAASELHCKLQGGHLASVLSSEENKFIMDTFYKSSKKNIWLGASYEAGTYQWSDGNEFTYTHWATGEPNNVQNSCIHLWHVTERWYDGYCDVKRGFICQNKYRPVDLGNSSDEGPESIENETLTTDITLELLNKEGEVFMEKESFEEGQVLVKYNGTLYDIIPHLIVLSNMTMFLETVSPEEVVWQNDETFDMKGHIFTKVDIPKEVPEDGIENPEPGIYVYTKSGYMPTLILVFYSADESPANIKLMGMKLTGSSYVPSGKVNFKYDRNMKELLVQHAYTNFRNPYWNTDYEMVRIGKYNFEMKKSSTMNIYNHMARFQLIFI